MPEWGIRAVVSIPLRKFPRIFVAVEKEPPYAGFHSTKEVSKGLRGTVVVPAWAQFPFH